MSALTFAPEEIAAFAPAGGRAHVEYRNDPVGWAAAKMGISESTLRWSLNAGYDAHAWDGDVDPLVAVYHAIRDWKDVGAESGTGTGKSYGVAILILWFLACWENSLAFTFAPVEKQLKLYIWKNIGELFPRFRQHFPQAELTDLCLRMRGGIDESWAAHGYAVGVKAGEQVSTAAAGMHAEHMLLVYEETPGIPLPVMEAGENTCVGPHNLRLAIGNPNNQLDALHRFCTSPGVRHVRISALDHPNVVTGNDSLIPGAVSAPKIERRRLKYGESSPVYESRVRGISPEQASDSLIRLEWLKASAARWLVAARDGRISKRATAKGVDVANSKNGDRACIVDFAERFVIRIDAFSCPDSNALGRQVALEMDAANLKPAYVGVDPIGVGAGTVNELRRMRKDVQALAASERAVDRAQRAPDGSSCEWVPDANLFKNFRSQVYWQAREDLRLGMIDVPEDLALWEELTAFTFVDEPKTLVEAKDEVAERLGRSPDKSDAFVLANWVRPRRKIDYSNNDYRDAAGHDPAVVLTTRDGKPPVWIGPEGDMGEFSGGYASQLPVNI